MKDLQLALELDSCTMLDTSGFTTINIENKHYFYIFIKNLGLECRSEICDRTVLSLFSEGVKLQLSKVVLFVSDYSQIDFNSRPINSAILKKLVSFLATPEELEVRSTFEKCINQIVSDFKEYAGLNIDSNVALQLTDIAKVCSPVVIDDKANLLERLLAYIDLCVELRSVKIIILISLKLYLSDEEISQLHKYCLDQELFLILVESCDCSGILACEKRIVIDSQMCLIYQHF